MTKTEQRQMDKAKLAFFLKGLVTWGLVVQKGGTMNQRPKMELNRLMATATTFNRTLDQSLGPEEAEKANDFVDDLSAFFERFITGDIETRGKIIDFINSLPEL